MKLIKAIVRPNRVDDVREALEKMNIPGMTVTEVRGHGRQKGHKEIYRGSEYTVNFVPKIKIEIAVNDDVAERAVQTIEEAARTDHIGDGKIFVLPMDAAVRIRTGETGANAL